MTNKIQYNQLLAKSLLLSLSLILIACGGGGGGGGGPTYPNISYTGNNSQAVITESNAKDFPIALLEGTTNSVPPTGIISDNSSLEKIQRSILLKSGTKIIKSTALRALSSKTEPNIVVAATIPHNGTCPSPGTLTETDNSVNGNINGNIIFNNYCEGTQTNSTTIHGKISLAGTYHINTSGDPIFDTLTINVEYMRVSVKSASENYSEEFSGSVNITQFDGTSENDILKMTFSTNFKSEGQTYKVKNFTFDTSGVTTLNLDGLFYHPTHGYINATTTEPFNLVTNSDSPDKYCNGTMQISGDGGDIEFIANFNCSQYRVTFTASGNSSGTPDYDSLMIDWQ